MDAEGENWAPSLIYAGRLAEALVKEGNREMEGGMES